MAKYNNETILPTSFNIRSELPSFQYHELEYSNEDLIDDIKFDIYRGQNTETFHSDCLATGKVIICAYGYMKDQDTLRDLYSYDDYNI